MTYFLPMLVKYTIVLLYVPRLEISWKVWEYNHIIIIVYNIIL